MAAAVINKRLAVAWATIGVIRIRVKRRVTCKGALLVAGFTALHPPLAAAGYSPPGALGGGVVSTVDGGFGSVMYSHAALGGGVALVIGPCGQGAVTGAPISCVVTVASTLAFVGRVKGALMAVRAPSRAAWFSVS